MSGRRQPRLVSVVLPVRDEREHLPEQLEALAAQDYRGGWELIVADNGSRDGSAELVEGWMSDHGVGRLVAAGAVRGPGAARNAGVRAARGDLLVSCDADDVVAPDWLRLLVDAAGEADLVAGAHEGSRLNDRATCACHSLPPPEDPFLGHLPIAAGSNLAIWSDVFHALGGFDERGGSGGEDASLSWRAQEAGYRFATAPDAIVHKRFETGLRSVARQYYAYGQSDAALFSRFRGGGMPRRGAREALALWRDLLRGSVHALWSPYAERCRWVQLAALSCGRLAGSIRQRALFL